jgi:predicted dehydrogenase
MLVGVGRMGHRHLDVLRALPGMTVAAVCDQSSEALQSVREQPGLTAAVYGSDALELFAKVRPDAVVISTTAPSHAQFVCAAAENGARYILCEKPMATSLADAQRMIATCERHGVVLAINHQMQFMAQYTEVRALVHTPELGGLTSIMVAGSNFGLAMNASHYFEMFRYMTGQTAAFVSAWFDAARVLNPRGPQFEDRAGALRAVSASGISMYVDFSSRAGHGLQVVYICRYGQIVVDELSGFMRVIRRQDQYRELPTTRYGMPADEAVRAIEPADVIGPTRAVWDAMLAGRAFPDGMAGKHAVECLCAAHASNGLGGLAVRLDDPRIDRELRHPWA